MLILELKKKKQITPEFGAYAYIYKWQSCRFEKKLICDAQNSTFSQLKT